MNTSPAASTQSVRSEPTATSTAAGNDAPANAFELLFGTGFALPLLMPAGEASGTADDAPEAPEGALGDLSGWMQQLPLSPLAEATAPPAGQAAAALPSLKLGPVQLQGPAAGAHASAPALDTSLAELTGMAAEAADTQTQRLTQQTLSASPQPAMLGEVVTKALMRRTEMIAPREAATLPATLPAAAADAASPDAPLEVVLPPGSAPKIDQAFGEGMAIRLQWMAQQQIGRAEIQLHPEDLGSIDVQIDFDGKAVRAEFHSPISEVRQLLESSLPRLRDLLESQGLQLQHADVGNGQGRQAQRDGSGQPGIAQQVSHGDGPAESSPSAGAHSRRHDGALSEYA